MKIRQAKMETVKLCPKDNEEMEYRICFGDSFWICLKCGEISKTTLVDYGAAIKNHSFHPVCYSK